MNLPDGEPRFGPWRTRRIDEVLSSVLGARTGPRPLLLAVDGRSGSGKTTVAQRLLDRVPGAAIVHTDDVAWYHAMFDWAELIIDGLLAPLRRGEAVAFRPPPWAERPFLAAERSWERADVVVDGAPTFSHDPRTELVVALPAG